MKQALIYSIKVWLTSAVLGAVLISVWGLITKPGQEPAIDLVGFAVFSFGYGLMYSIPLFVLMTICTWILLRLSWEVWKVKLVLSSVGIITTVCLMTMIFPFMKSPVLPVCYTAASVATIWLYKLKPVKVTSVES